MLANRMRLSRLQFLPNHLDLKTSFPMKKMELNARLMMTASPAFFVRAIESCNMTMVLLPKEICNPMIHSLHIDASVTALQPHLFGLATATLWQSIWVWSKSLKPRWCTPNGALRFDTQHPGDSNRDDGNGCLEVPPQLPLHCKAVSIFKGISVSFLAVWLFSGLRCKYKSPFPDSCQKCFVDKR